MSRRGIPKGGESWYLRQWMETRGLSGRGAQKKMMALTGWSPATMSQLFTGQQDFSPTVLRAAAKALDAEPYELLMPPEKAMSLRKMLDGARGALAIASDPEIENEGDKPRTAVFGERCSPID